MLKIKPCPFCGSKAEVIGYEYGTVTIGCTNEECDITMGKGFLSDEGAIIHWNRRNKTSTNKGDERIRFCYNEILAFPEDKEDIILTFCIDRKELAEFVFTVSKNTDTKQWQIYDNEAECYIDLPSSVLKELETLENNEAKIRLSEIILEMPDWIFNEDSRHYSWEE